MNRTLLAALLLPLAACSGGGDDSEAAETTEPEPLPVVSLQTTCDLLFNQDSGEFGLWGRATDVVAGKANEGTWDADEAEAVNKKLGEIAATSRPAIQPHIESMAEMLSSSDALDISTYKTVATEVSNQCAPLVVAE